MDPMMTLIYPDDDGWMIMLFHDCGQLIAMGHNRLYEDAVQSARNMIGQMRAAEAHGWDAHGPEFPS